MNTMKTLSLIFTPGLVALFLLAGCITANISHEFPAAQKRTVTFMIHHMQGSQDLNPAEQTIVDCLKKEPGYLPEYIEVNYDSVEHIYGQLYSKLNFEDHLFHERKNQYMLFAKAAGTDHVMDLEMETQYDTIITPPKERTILQRWLLGMKDTPEEISYSIREIKFRLRYVEGHTGKTLWKMSCRYPSGFFGGRRDNAMDELAYRFRKEFPFKKN